LGWCRDGQRGAGAGCPWRLSNGERGSVRSSTRVMKRCRRTKRGCYTVVCSLYSCQRRWNESGETVGGKQRQRSCERGPHAVLIFFPIYPKPAQLEKFKMGVLSCSKNSQFLYALSWDNMNNFLNCADIKFLTQTELKILDHIQYLNIW
jgi:hypothetical protein